MDIDNLKKFINLLIAALGIFALIFIVYSMIIVSKIAQDKKRKQEIKKGYADEYISPTVFPVKLP